MREKPTFLLLYDPWSRGSSGFESHKPCERTQYPLGFVQPYGRFSRSFLVFVHQPTQQEWPQRALRGPRQCGKGTRPTLLDSEEDEPKPSSKLGWLRQLGPLSLDREPPRHPQCEWSCPQEPWVSCLCEQIEDLEPWFRRWGLRESQFFQMPSKWILNFIFEE